MNWRFLLVSGGLCIGSQLALAQTPMTPAEAFAAGQSSGDTAKKQTAFDDINAVKGAAGVVGYSSTAAETSYWSPTTPIASVLSGGTSKITSCTSTPSADPAIQNQCEAILALQKQPSIKPTGLVSPTDLIVTKGDAITANPEAIAGSMSAAYSACTTKTVSLGKDKTTESCDEYSTTGTVNCSIGTKVTVDADHLFKCLDTVRVVANTTCTVGRVVTVDADANYQCDENLITTESLGCSKIASGTIYRAFDFTMGDVCSVISTVCNLNITKDGAAMEARFQAAYALGQRRAYVNNVYALTLTGPTIVELYPGRPHPLNSSYMFAIGSQGSPMGVNSSWLFNWQGPATVIYSGSTLKLCGSGNCTSAVAVMSGPDVVGYTCNATGSGTSCPPGFYSIGGASCRSNTFAAYSGNPSCSLVRSVASTIPGTQSAVEHDFFCKTEDNRCASLEARAL